MEARNIISIERENNEYMIKMGTKLIITTFANNELGLKNWLAQVQKLYVKKNKQPLVVGLFADRSTGNYSSGDGSLKDGKYKLLQLCVGNHCLLWEIPYGFYRFQKGYPPTQVPKALKDFFDNNRTTVVGVKIKDIAKKLENETDLLIRKTLDLRDLAEEKLGRTKGEFVKYKVHELAKLVLGDQMDQVIKPNKLSWWAPGAQWNRLSDDLVKFASIEVFLAAELGSKLL